MIVDGAVVPRCGARRLVKIIFRESMRQGIECVHVCTCGRRRRVSESWLCPSARLYEGLLQLKRVTVEVCTVFRELCPYPRGASWLRPAWFGAMPKADSGRRSYCKAGMCAGSRR